ncbi:Serine-pyruvate aminotransferase/archaeal aspartate aminotransferase [Candidatus Burkholderia humilis]|nr:Serine-pyruvate aminotransferase/archaeal aspartate aminotransferase [Candidatus Burkholderia humilis]
MERTVWYVDVQSRQTVTWRVSRDAELRVGDASVWLTRHGDGYDYWLKPGDIVRFVRGERVWISSDSEHAVEVSLTSYRALKRGLFTRYWPRILNAI